MPHPGAFPLNRAYSASCDGGDGTLGTSAMPDHKVATVTWRPCRMLSALPTRLPPGGQGSGLKRPVSVPAVIQRLHLYGPGETLYHSFRSPLGTLCKTGRSGRRQAPHALDG